MQGSVNLHHVSGFFGGGYIVDPIRVACGRYASNLAGVGESVSSLEWKELGWLQSGGHLNVRDNPLKSQRGTDLLMASGAACLPGYIFVPAVPEVSSFGDTTGSNYIQGTAE
jgi:hypothetical protein